MGTTLHVFNMDDDGSDNFYPDTEAGMIEAEDHYYEIVAEGGNARLYREDNEIEDDDPDASPYDEECLLAHDPTDHAGVIDHALRTMRDAEHELEMWSMSSNEGKDPDTDAALKDIRRAIAMCEGYQRVTQ